MLWFFSRLISPPQKQFLPSCIDRILVVAPPRIGDAALALPVFASLRQGFPESRLHVAANKYVSEMLCLVREIDEIVPVSQGLKTNLSALRGIFVPREYDIGVDLNFDHPLLPALLAGFSAAFSIGYEYAGRGFFLSKSLSPPEPTEHASDVFFQPVLKILPSEKKRAPQLDIPKELTLGTQSMLSRAGIAEKDSVILMHPGAHHPTQRWLPEHFAEAAERIIGARLAKVVFVGGRDEKNLIERIRKKMAKPPHAIFTDLTINRLIALIQRARLMICNNSGPLHLAVAVNTPTVSTMGPTIKDRWKPLGDNHKVLRIDDLPCIGCNLGFCKIRTHDCMALIKPSMVLKATCDLLGIHQWPC